MTKKLTSTVYVRYGDLNHHFVLFGNSVALKSWAALGTWAPRTVFSVLGIQRLVCRLISRYDILNPNWKIGITFIHFEFVDVW